MKLQNAEIEEKYINAEALVVSSQEKIAQLESQITNANRLEESGRSDINRLNIELNDAKG